MNNMSFKFELKIIMCKFYENWIKVLFKFDFFKFNMIYFESDVVVFMSKCVVDIVGCIGKGCKVELNGKCFLIKLF